MSTSGIGAARLDHVGIMVPDMDEAIAWYTQQLGCTVRDRWANPEIGMEWAHLVLGGVVLELVRRPSLGPLDPAAAGIHHVALVVDDCAAVVEDLAGRGVAVLFQPSYFERHDMDWAFVTDHLGNVLEILSYRSGADAH